MNRTAMQYHVSAERVSVKLVDKSVMRLCAALSISGLL